MLTEEEQERKITTYEEAFVKIKEATGVSGTQVIKCVLVVQLTYLVRTFLTINISERIRYTCLKIPLTENVFPLTLNLSLTPKHNNVFRLTK